VIRADYAGTLSRMELEIKVAELQGALQREHVRSSELADRLAQVQAARDDQLLSTKETDRPGSGGTLVKPHQNALEEQVAALRRERAELLEEINATKEQLRRRNREQARDGRTIAELTDMCERLQAQLEDAAVNASAHRSHDATLAHNMSSSQRSDCAPPQLAKKLPSPASSHRRMPETPSQLSATRQPAVIAVTRPKEPSWFDGPAVSWLARTTEAPLPKLAADKPPEARWFGGANPLDMLGITAPVKQGMAQAAAADA
jgi:hypothetical protein